MPLARIDIPDLGRIVGGRLAGWYFKFLNYVATVDEAKVRARVTPMRWPFPRDIVLEADHWKSFAPDKEGRMLNGDQLIYEEYKAVGLPIPKYLREGSLRLQQIIKANEKKRKAVPQ